MILACIFALLAGARTGWGWVTLHATWTPDYDEYTQGGIGFYPSPLGRLVGSTGLLGVANIFACFALPLLVAVVARRRGGKPALAAFFASLAPLAWVGAWASVDALAMCLLVAALLYTGWRRFTLAILAATTHWAVLPYALLLVARRRDHLWLGILAFATAPAVAYTLLTTKYGDAAGKFALLHAITGFTGTFLIVGLLSGFLLWPVLHNRLVWLLWLTVSAAEAGLQGHVHLRYGLPAAIIAATGVGGYRRTFIRQQAIDANLHSTQTANQRVGVGGHAGYGQSPSGMTNPPEPTAAVLTAAVVQIPGQAR